MQRSEDIFGLSYALTNAAMLSESNYLVDFKVEYLARNPKP